MRGGGAAKCRRSKRLPAPSSDRHIGTMPDENLTPDERGELLKLLRDTIAADHYPLSRRIRNLKSALAKLAPQRQPGVEPFPPPTGWSTAPSDSGRAAGRVRGDP